MDWFLAGARDFFFPLLQAFRLTTTYSVGNEVCFPRDKGAGVEVLPLTPSSWWVKDAESSTVTSHVSCVVLHTTPGQLYLLHLFCLVTYSVLQFQLYFMWLHVCDTSIMLQIWFYKFMHSIIWQPAWYSLRFFHLTAGRAALTLFQFVVSVSNRFLLAIFKEVMQIVCSGSQHTSHVKTCLQHVGVILVKLKSLLF